MKLSEKYSYKRWTKAEVETEAKKYNSRSEFRRANQGAYAFALNNGLLDNVCAHMKPLVFWNIFELMAVARKYDNLQAFRKSEPEAYNYATKSQLLKLATSHMARHVIQWTKELVLEEAAKHNSRGMFQAAASGAYKHADKYGYMDEACAHMPDPEYGFSKEKLSRLYHLKIKFVNGLTLYKLGITNRLVMARIAGMGVPDGSEIEVLNEIEFERGRDARITEKRLHRRFKNHRYNGEPLLKNGNTELFYVPLIE